MKACDHGVPFYSNTEDGTHCFQASVRMVVKALRPALDYSWHALDGVTGKIEGGDTWPFAGTVWLHEQGFDVRYIELADNRRFADEGKAYLLELYGEHANAADPRTDYAQEQAHARRMVENVRCEVRVPTADDLRTLLSDGFVLICYVNSRALNGKDGHRGHFVVVKGFDAEALVMHDPGPPATENRRMSFAAFERAWGYPDDRTKCVLAVRAPPRARSAQTET
jgi:hypothetical protein